MRGNTFGRFLALTTFGESHGVALGAVMDGCPSEIALDKEDFSRELRRRRPGQSSVVSPRNEEDLPEILSGVFEGKTLGTPISVIVRNQDARSGDYSPDQIRPGHADEAWTAKFAHRDWRGGGRSSGRETLSRVLGGVVARKIVPDVSVLGFTRSIGGLHLPEEFQDVSFERIEAEATRCPDPKLAKEMEKELQKCQEMGTSRGGVAEIWIDGLEAGQGEPVFRKMKSELAAAMMSIGSVSGVELGLGFRGTEIDGKAFHKNRENLGGIQGGITNGERILIRVAFKPTSTLGEKAKQGRHDPCIIPRAIPVLESMAYLVLADLALERRLNGT